jgi:hypothetical protein
MGKIKYRLCFKKKQAKKTIFAPKIALRVEFSDPARNPYFPADFLSARFRCSQLPRNSVNITARALTRKKTPTISLNCGVTHSPDFPHANTQKNTVKNVFVIYRVLCLTAR